MNPTTLPAAERNLILDISPPIGIAVELKPHSTYVMQYTSVCSAYSRYMYMYV